jgi:hypothetical protein
MDSVLKRRIADKYFVLLHRQSQPLKVMLTAPLKYLKYRPNPGRRKGMRGEVCAVGDEAG